MYYQIIHVTTALALFCYSQHVVELGSNSNPPPTTSVWQVEDSGLGDDTFYICNDSYGTCLGNLHQPETSDFVGAEDKEKATGKQLLWYYNSTDQTLATAEDLNIVLSMITVPDDSPFSVAVELHAKGFLTTPDAQNFSMVVSATKD